MSNYIDREVLLKDLEKSVVISCKTEKLPYLQRVLNKFINCIKAQPKADVVEVIRCKECKHFGTDAFGRTVCVRDFQMICIEDDNFCSHGVKSEV